MSDNFDKWNIRKRQLHRCSAIVLFHERELWWCSVGINIGHEENGKGVNFVRPVVVFRKFNREVFWGVPVTTKLRSEKYYVSISVGDDLRRQAKISQLRLLDARRLVSKIGMIGVSDYAFIEKAITDVSVSQPLSQV